MIELLGDLIEWIGDLFDVSEGVTEVVGGGADILNIAFDVVSTALLIQGAVYVASLTVDSIRSELNNRRELKNKGVTNVIIQEFIEKNGYTEISLAALNAQNQQVGTVQMRTKGSSNVEKGQRIKL
ncbi:MAG: hypothetical protein J1F40_09165 [Prevotellaceae bacterium]|nr:hypothetical protein [Prevotellaceae bacterium]